MPVTDAMVASALEGRSLNNVIAEKRLFIIDLRYMAEIECSQDRKVRTYLAVNHCYIKPS